MKYVSLLFLLITLAFCQTVMAQDKLRLRNGDEMQVRVLEIAPDSVLYTRTMDSATAKISGILKDSIFSITYQSGKV